MPNDMTKYALNFGLAIALLIVIGPFAVAHDASADMLKRTKRAVVIITTYDQSERPLLCPNWQSFP